MDLQLLEDLTYVLFDNESTGGQNTYQKHVDYIAIAKASGLEQTIVSKTINELDKTKGLKFLHVKCGNDDETPRPPIEVSKF